MKIYRLLKFIHIVLHVIFGFIFILFFPFLNQDIRFKIIELWSTWFLKILKIKLTVNDISTNIENKSPLVSVLSVNDIIIEVQKNPVKNSSDLKNIVDSIFKKGEKTLLLTVINKNNRRRYLGVKIN